MMSSRLRLALIESNVEHQRAATVSLSCVAKAGWATTPAKAPRTTTMAVNVKPTRALIVSASAACG